ncbi:unnamed protein product [Symbiodinium necroappetens]|uniref:Uncharacterized protein n=1 Tax=Symbiodinium necroappetens TaxID=1628268 RepID=A0A812YI23_9DINO|nr:unnamed protein product [Symbiodinium necroappetens]
MQSFHTLNFFHQQGQWASLRDMARTCWQSYLLILKFFMAPFFEARFLDTWLTSQVDFDTWAVFVPGTGKLKISSFTYQVCPLHSIPQLPFPLNMHCSFCSCTCYACTHVSPGRTRM